MRFPTRRAPERELGRDARELSQEEIDALGRLQ
jgi:hypothetical protein